jgi:hypothetical protein
MKLNMKKVGKILKEGGWKSPDKLFDIENEDYPILILYDNGKVIKGGWYSKTHWIRSKIEGDGIVAWKEYVPRTIFQKIKERFKNEVVLFIQNNKQNKP